MTKQEQKEQEERRKLENQIDQDLKVKQKME